eukprot:gene28496-34402_t
MLTWLIILSYFLACKSRDTIPSPLRAFKQSTRRNSLDMNNDASNAFNKNILVTGGTGYIGVHTIVSLVQAGYNVTVVDNLVNSSPEGLRRVPEITGCSPDQISFFQIDLCNAAALEEVFQKSAQFGACIHFAGLKAVGESVAKPLLYYENNLLSTINLLNLMEKYGCRTFVFSSSATVYGAAPVPIHEDTPTGQGITNAYGRTKYMIEEILKDFKRAQDLKGGEHDKWSVAVLRYFNPVGAHPSGRIGEDPNGVPNNLMPYVAQVVVGRRDKLTVFGNDYPTSDGTGVRDYIHIMDLADGHLAALQYMMCDGRKEISNPAGHGKFNIFNLGTGKGFSVLQMIEAMKAASGRDLPYVFAPRREGDIAVCYADPTVAERELGWKAARGLDEMCRDLWNWQSNNPNGYK